MSNLSISVEIMPGAHINGACQDMIDLATKLGHPVEAKFNDILVIAMPGADPDELSAAWFKEMDSRHPVKIACVHPTNRKELGNG